MGRPSTSGESATLSRDLTDFLIELSIGLHKNAIYPPGHPRLEHTSSEIKRRLDVLMKEREALSLSLYGDGHRARERVIDQAYDSLQRLLEAESVVRSLSLAMHGDKNIVIPLLQLKEFDQYTTTHSLNVSVLTMALAEWMGMGAKEVQAFGVAGLLHDLGKVRIPRMSSPTSTARPRSPTSITS